MSDLQALIKAIATERAEADALIREQAAEIERLKADRNEWKRQYYFLVDEFNDAVDEAVRRESTPPSQGSPQSDRPA